MHQRLPWILPLGCSVIFDLKNEKTKGFCCYFYSFSPTPRLRLLKIQTEKRWQNIKKNFKGNQEWWSEVNIKNRLRKEKRAADGRERDAAYMGCDSEWGGGEKPRRGIMNEEKGSVHDFCRVWESGPVFLSHPRASHLTSLWLASEATRKPLRPAAHMQKGLVH